MVQPDTIKNLSDKEKQIVAKLSPVVDIVKEIYLKQKNQVYPAGNLYPPDITREEFDQAAIRDPELKRFDTVVERMNASRLCAVPYNERYQTEYSRMKKYIAEALALSENESFRRYLKSLLTCLISGTPEDYWLMMTEWVRTKEYAINFPFTYDEPYMDRLVGIKGGFNAGIFLQEAELTAQITRPLETLEDFKSTLVFPAPPKVFPNLQAAVYRTVKHEGMMAEMELRAWNLPNDLHVRETVGARQTIIKEGQERACLKQAWPIAQQIFPEAISQISQDNLLAGFFAVAMMHEISHNIGRYEKESDLEKYFSVFEELKAYLLPILWTDFLTQKNIFTKSQKQAAVLAIFSINFVDIILAETIKARESYSQSAIVKFNYLLQAGAVKINDGRIAIDLDLIVPAARELFNKVIELAARGNFQRAKKYIDQYGSKQSLEPVIKRLKGIINAHV